MSDYPPRRPERPSPRATGTPYAYCVGCGVVATHDGEQEGAHHWIERQADADERRVLAGIVCNVCAPRPDLLCAGCNRIGHGHGNRVEWTSRRPMKREAHRLPRRRCPDCEKKTAIGAP